VPHCWPPVLATTKLCRRHPLFIIHPEPPKTHPPRATHSRPFIHNTCRTYETSDLWDVGLVRHTVWRPQGHVSMSLLNIILLYYWKVCISDEHRQMEESWHVRYTGWRFNLSHHNLQISNSIRNSIRNSTHREWLHNSYIVINLMRPTDQCICSLLTPLAWITIRLLRRVIRHELG